MVERLVQLLVLRAQHVDDLLVVADLVVQVLEDVVQTLLLEVPAAQGRLKAVEVLLKLVEHLQVVLHVRHQLPYDVVLDLQLLLHRLQHLIQQHQVLPLVGHSPPLLDRLAELLHLPLLLRALLVRLRYLLVDRLELAVQPILQVRHVSLHLPKDFPGVLDPVRGQLRVCRSISPLRLVPDRGLVIHGRPAHAVQVDDHALVPLDLLQEDSPHLLHLPLLVLQLLLLLHVQLFQPLLLPPQVLYLVSVLLQQREVLRTQRPAHIHIIQDRLVLHPLRPGRKLQRVHRLGEVLGCRGDGADDGCP
mmetsp:Transcript_9985/g.33299  ORF Transcript_9985/g.33299 Transcript_9985/m.33299 type:complete len:304 (+) Transcript_9985:1376-2287(+)